MAVTLRLVRLGRRNRSFFRLRAADQRDAATGRFIEELGTLDPIEKDKGKQVTLKRERIEHWVRSGAKITPSVKTLLKKEGIDPAKRK